MKKQSLVLALLLILFSLSTLVGCTEECPRDRSHCIGIQSNLEIEIARYLQTHPTVLPGPAGARLSDPNAKPNAQDLMDSASNPDNIRQMLVHSEKGEDENPIGYHYAYTDDSGHIECAVDNAGLLRVDDADVNHDRFSTGDE